MYRIHSIRNPDSFSDCISMLFCSKQKKSLEYNIDIVSQRCFRLQYEQKIKQWIHTAVSAEDSVRNICLSTGSKLCIQKVRNMSREGFRRLAESGVVLGPLKRSGLNQNVEDMYFIGGNQFFFLAGIKNEYAVIHDPDSSPCIMFWFDEFFDILIREDAFCITAENEWDGRIDSFQVMKKGISCYLKSERPSFMMKTCKGGTDIASYRYGLRLFLFYNYEVLSSIKASMKLDEEITEYFRFSSEGYFDCRWEKFMEIELRFRNLLGKCRSFYGIES